MRRYWLALALVALGAGVGCGRTDPLEGVGIDPAHSTVMVDREAGLLADGTDQAVITVKLVDAAGRSLPKRKVGFTATGSGNVLRPPTALSDENGLVVARLSSTRAGVKVITATVNPDTSPLPLAQQPAVSFGAAAVDPDASTVEVSPSSLLADGVATSAITVTLRDARGNAIPGHLVRLMVTGEGQTITQPAAPTDERGVATGAVSSLRAERKNVMALADPDTALATVLTQRPGIAFRPGVASVTRSSVSATPSAVLADGMARATLTVTIRDGNGNPISGLPVALRIEGGAIELVQPDAPTDDRGMASGTLASTRAEVKVVSAILNPGPAPLVLAQRTTVTFVPGPPDAANCTLAVAPEPQVADGSTASLIVTVRDANGNPVPGQSVVFAADGSANALFQPPSLTDAAGVATGALASTKAEVKNVTATLNPGPGELVLGPHAVTFTAGIPSAALSSLEASPLRAIANGSEQVSLKVVLQDANGNLVPGQTVRFVSTGSANALSQPASVTDLSGVATGALASTKAELKTVSAVINPGPAQLMLAQTVAVTFDPGAPSASTSALSASPSSLMANGVATSTITVTVKDASGNPVPGQLVALAATGGGTVLTQPSSATGAAGMAAGTLKATLAGAKVVTATVNPGPSQLALTESATVTFTAGIADPATSTVSAAPSLVTADGVAVTTVTITLRDASGNPVAGLPVRLDATGSANVIVQPGPSDIAGMTTGTLASTQAELKTITATANPGPTGGVLAQQPTVSFVPGPPNAAASSVTASPLTARANGAETITVSITVRDASGNPVPGQTVQLTATGTANTLVQPAAPADAAGLATGALRSTRAQAKTITATVNPGPSQVVLAEQPTVTFTPGPPSGSTSSVSASPTTVAADGTTTTAISVTLVDAFGNPIPGQVVQLSATGAGNVLAQPGTTDAAGLAVGTLASSRVGTKVITATANPGPSQVVLDQQPVVTFIPGAPSATRSTVTAVPLSVRADGTTTSLITVTVLDAGGNPVPGQTVLLAASGTRNTLVQPSSPTDNAGVATGTLASKRAEAKVVSATVNPGPSGIVLAQQPTVTFTPLDPDASASSMAANPTIVLADGVTTSTLTATVLDSNDNPLAGQVVQFVATGTGHILVQPSGLTDATGTATGTIAASVVGTKTVSAVVNPGASEITVSQTSVISFVAGPPSATTSTVTASPSSVVADGSAASTVTVTVKDSTGNPLAGLMVQLDATGTGNTLTQPSAPTDATGTAVGTLRSTRTGAKAVTATVNPGPSQVVLAQQPTVTFVAGPISATASTVVASPSIVLADGTATSTVTVTVTDAVGNPISGQTVRLAATGTSNTIVQPSAVTDIAGVATGTIASTRAEVKTLSALVNPGPGQIALAQQPTVAFITGPPSASTSTVAAAPATVIADGTSTSTVTVTVRDAGGNPIAGLPVSLSATGAGNALVQPPSTTNASGVATGAIASTRPGPKVITATVNPGPSQVVVAQQPTVTFIVGSPDATTSTLTASPSIVVADGVATTTVTVTVLDAQGNPVSGQMVQLAATGTGNTITQPSAVTDIAGVATGTVASTQVEIKTISALVNPGPSQVAIAQRADVSFVTGPPDAAASSVSVAPATVVANGIATATVTVTLRDSLGRPLPGVLVQLAATGTGNTLVQPATTTDSSGVTTGTIASTRAEVKTISAIANPGPGQTDLSARPTVTFVAGPPSAPVSTLSASPTSVAADGSAVSTLTVTVKDAQGNPVSGALVTLAATGTQNTFVQPGAPTDASGVATGTLASTRIEPKTITATVNPGPGQVVLDQQATVNFIAGPPSATQSTASASPLTVVADGVATSTITVTVKDSLGNPISGQAVRLSSTGTSNIIAQPPATDASGVTQGTLGSRRAEVKTITATVNPGSFQVVVNQRPAITFVAGPADATASTVTAAPTTVAADGTSTSTLTVTLRDVQGNAVQGATVVLSATGSSNIFVQPGLTSSSGVGTGTLASGRAETKQVTATVNPGPSQVVLSQKPSITFVAGNPGTLPGSGCTQASSIAIDPATGNPAIAYYQGQNLLFSKCLSNCTISPVWSSPEVIDVNVVRCNRPQTWVTLAYVAPGVPAVAYRDLINKPIIGCTAKYAVNPGTGWAVNVVENIDPSGTCNVTGFVSMALVGASNTPVIAYHSHSFSVRGARFASCAAGCDTGTGMLWNRQNVDALGDNVGHYINAARDPVSGLPRLIYTDDISTTEAPLKYATCADASPTATCERGQGNWTIGYVEQIFGVKLGSWASLAFRPDGTPIASYQDETNSRLKFATCTGNCSDAATSTWTRTVVDPGPFTGLYTFVRADSLGQARISYFYQPGNQLKYAMQSGSTTTFAITPIDSTDEGQSSFVLSPPGTHFSYATSTSLVFYPAGL